MWLLCVAIKAGRYEGNVYERRLIINILVESASAQTVRTEVVASEDRYHHAQDMSAVLHYCYSIYSSRDCE